MSITTALPSPHWDAIRKATELGLMSDDVTPDEHVENGRRMHEFIKFILANVLDIDGPTLAVMFHNNYERLAPSYGYETRKETRKFDPDSPNGKLMIATCEAIMNELTKR